MVNTGFSLLESPGGPPGRGRRGGAPGDTNTLTRNRSMSRSIGSTVTVITAPTAVAGHRHRRRHPSLPCPAHRDLRWPASCRRGPHDEADPLLPDLPWTLPVRPPRPRRLPLGGLPALRMGRPGAAADESETTEADKPCPALAPWSA